MGARGPARKPNHLKVVAGTLKASTPPDVEPIPRDQTLIELPPAPTWMESPIALAEWKKTGNLLLSRGLLDDARVNSFAIYCALTGKIAQKFQAGDTPAAHLIAQHKSLGKELGIIGTSAKSEEATKPATAGRFASLKARAQRPD